MQDIEVDILIAITTDDGLRAKWRQLGAAPSPREAAVLFDDIQASLASRTPACHPDHRDTWFGALWALRERYPRDPRTLTRSGASASAPA